MISDTRAKQNHPTINMSSFKFSIFFNLGSQTPLQDFQDPLRGGKFTFSFLSPLQFLQANFSNELLPDRFLFYVMYSPSHTPLCCHSSICDPSFQNMLAQQNNAELTLICFDCDILYIMVIHVLHAKCKVRFIYTFLYHFH